jgi:hypothetical protein
MSGTAASLLLVAYALHRGQYYPYFNTGYCANILEKIVNYKSENRVGHLNVN